MDMNYLRMTLAGVAISATACSRQQPRDEAILEQIGKAGCNHRLRLIAIIPDSMSGGAACKLATGALAFLGSGGGNDVGFHSADTNRLTYVVVASNDYIFPDRPPKHFWSVGFANPAASTGIAVEINRVSGALDARLTGQLDTLLKRK
jgi:hypothetical protein